MAELQNARTLAVEIHRQLVGSLRLGHADIDEAAECDASSCREQATALRLVTELLEVLNVHVDRAKVWADWQDAERIPVEKFFTVPDGVYGPKMTEWLENARTEALARGDDPGFSLGPLKFDLGAWALPLPSLKGTFTADDGRSWPMEITGDVIDALGLATVRPVPEADPEH